MGRLSPAIPETFEGLPVLTAQAMQELDRKACEKAGLTALGLMENAGRAVAAETTRYLKEKLGKELRAGSIVVCCGRGSNGGDGLAAARILKENQAAVEVFICPAKRAPGGEAAYPEPVRVNIEKARAAGILVREFEAAALGESLSRADAALDALLGTGSTGKPAGPIRDMIQALTRSRKPVLAVDIPSGLNPDTGHHSGAYVTAAATFTLGFAKRGLLALHARKYVGELKVLDIGYPKSLSTKSGFD